MKSVQTMLQTQTESKQTSTETEFLVDGVSLGKQSYLTQCANEEKGFLNLEDGIECDICKNKGFIITDGEDEVSTIYHECKCMKKRSSKRVARNSGMGDLLDHRFKNYKTELQWQTDIKKLAAEFAQDNPFKNWFCLLGQSGSGKTMLCSAICNYLIHHFHSVRYMAWNTFASDLKEKFGNDSQAFIRTFQTAEVLYIDDFLKGSASKYDVKNIAFDLINYRYNNNLVTIISSELSFVELNKVDSAIAGRIKEKCGSFLAIIPKEESNNYRLTKKVIEL